MSTEIYCDVNGQRYPVRGNYLTVQDMSTGNTGNSGIDYMWNSFSMNPYNNYISYRYQVEIDIYFGGSWACPTMPDTECEVTVPSEVTCRWFRQLKYYDYNDYVQAHYHNSRYGHDDDTYDPDTYDSDTAPESRGINWSKNSEAIMGNCFTCEAMSQPTMRSIVNQTCKSTTDMYSFAGCVLACFGVAIVARYARKSRTMHHPNEDSDG